METMRIGVAYVSATGCALVVALGLKGGLAKRASPLFQRFVPFAAVVAANMVNIPLMRQSELLDGVSVYDQAGVRVGESRYAAVKGISQVTLSRILIAAPSMLLLPVLIEGLEKKAWFRRRPFLNAPLQVLVSGAMLLVMVPVGCAIFNQRSCIPSSRLKTIDRLDMKEIESRYGHLPEYVYFNKGL
ncbi:sideroflexin-2-like [Mya arenaria]|uniref:sideroflexin-2-like n=1 Tax=Mya arenaria TaxID=6604 RepID=UPI0022E447B0|nr:sideroflexin-2-like [Mya arenaria]